MGVLSGVRFPPRACRITLDEGGPRMDKIMRAKKQVVLDEIPGVRVFMKKNEIIFEQIIYEHDPDRPLSIKPEQLAYIGNEYKKHFIYLRRFDD